MKIIQHHKCSICHRNNIKLYRYAGMFLRDEEIYCRAHAPFGLIEKQALVPLIEDTDGSVWGLTSIPQKAFDAWNTLPDSFNLVRYYIREHNIDVDLLPQHNMQYITLKGYDLLDLYRVDKSAALLKLIHLHFMHKIQYQFKYY